MLEERVRTILAANLDKATKAEDKSLLLAVKVVLTEDIEALYGGGPDLTNEYSMGTQI
jgi:hypothetical protein